MVEKVYDMLQEIWMQRIAMTHTAKLAYLIAEAAALKLLVSRPEAWNNTLAWMLDNQDT